jgi:hypothetical protein
VAIRHFIPKMNHTLDSPGLGEPEKPLVIPMVIGKRDPLGDCGDKGKEDDEVRVEDARADDKTVIGHLAVRRPHVR